MKRARIRKTDDRPFSSMGSHKPFTSSSGSTMDRPIRNAAAGPPSSSSPSTPFWSPDPNSPEEVAQFISEYLLQNVRRDHTNLSGSFEQDPVPLVDIYPPRSTTVRHLDHEHELNDRVHHVQGPRRHQLDQSLRGRERWDLVNRCSGSGFGEFDAAENNSKSVQSSRMSLGDFPVSQGRTRPTRGRSYDRLTSHHPPQQLVSPPAGYSNAAANNGNAHHHSYSVSDLTQELHEQHHQQFSGGGGGGSNNNKDGWTVARASPFVVGGINNNCNDGQNKPKVPPKPIAASMEAGRRVASPPPYLEALSARERLRGREPPNPVGGSRGQAAVNGQVISDDIAAPVNQSRSFPNQQFTALAQPMPYNSQQQQQDSMNANINGLPSPHYQQHANGNMDAVRLPTSSNQQPHNNLNMSLPTYQRHQLNQHHYQSVTSANDNNVITGHNPNNDNFLAGNGNILAGNHVSNSLVAATGHQTDNSRRPVHPSPGSSASFSSSPSSLTLSSGSYSHPSCQAVAAAGGEQEAAHELMYNGAQSLSHRGSSSMMSFGSDAHDHQNSRPMSQGSEAAEIDDLLHIRGPYTEAAIVNLLESRFENNLRLTYMGPVLLSLGPGLPRGVKLDNSPGTQAVLEKFAKRIVRDHCDRQQSQVVVLTGVSGSGKSILASDLVNQIFRFGGGGCETDNSKHLVAALKVLRPLGTAKTLSHDYSSRMGYFLQLLDGPFQKNRINCYFLDQTRICRPPHNEQNMRILYDLVRGLPAHERSDLGLTSDRCSDFAILGVTSRDIEPGSEESQLAEWRRSLNTIGVNFRDVAKGLSAILHLGNIDVEKCGKDDISLQFAANMLGVDPQTLLAGLTIKTQISRGESFSFKANTSQANQSRNSLMRALYTRILSSIVKRINSSQPATAATKTNTNLNNNNNCSNLINGSSSKNSCSNSCHSDSGHDSSRSSSCGSSSDSQQLAGCNHSISMNKSVEQVWKTGPRQGNFIGIVDMFGLPTRLSRRQRLEELCMNLASEAIFHFYTTHTIRLCWEACSEEGIPVNQVEITDNSQVIHYISSKASGLFGILNNHPLIMPEEVLELTRTKIFCDKLETIPNSTAFRIHHYSGLVVYDVEAFPETNRDSLPWEVVNIFQQSSSGYISHLFSQELKQLTSQDTGGRSYRFRISPGTDSRSTFTDDFHTRLDSLLRILVSTRPHYVHCLRPSDDDSGLSRANLVSQCRSLQILETLNFYNGFSHRNKIRVFYKRYRILRKGWSSDINKFEDTLQAASDLVNFLNMIWSEEPSILTKECKMGVKHVFFSEAARQHLELRREKVQQSAARTLQRFWRRRGRQMRSPARNESLALKTLQFHGLQKDKPPPVPPPRTYRVIGNTKLVFGANRESPPIVVTRGEVCGIAHQARHLVQNNNGLSVVPDVAQVKPYPALQV